MKTVVTEFSDGLYQLSTFHPAANLRFNQYLVLADEPLLFHCGQHEIFPLVRDALATVMSLSELRWISYGHYEGDESGAMNDWLAVAPDACVAVGSIGCGIAARDAAIRPPRPLSDGETLNLGGKRVRYLSTPHVPHGWDAGVIYEETTNTLLCGDLFTQAGDGVSVSGDDIVTPALELEDQYHLSALTPQTAPTMRRLAALEPTTLGLMHGPVFQGDGGKALRDLAVGYEQRLQAATR